MPNSVAPSLQERSRLVRVLHDLSLNKLASMDANLAERLGHLVGLSGSMTLANGLRHLPAEAVFGVSQSFAEAQQEVLRARQHRIAVIVDSFSDASEAQNSLPSPAKGLRVEALKSFEPYQRFYTTHQIEMAVAIKTVRERLRKGMTSTSAELHQLAALDEVIDNSLEAQTRKLFNALLKLLELRFKELRAEFKGLKDWDGEDNAWLQPFYQDMRELLLAEFDARFQPVLGLLEAIQEHEQE